LPLIEQFATQRREIFSKIFAATASLFCSRNK
jgi:hypothetical protein